MVHVSVETSSPPPPVPVAGGVTAAGTFLIVRCVDGALRESGTGSCAAARQALYELYRDAFAANLSLASGRVAVDLATPAAAASASLVR